MDWRHGRQVKWLLVDPHHWQLGSALHGIHGIDGIQSVWMGMAFVLALDQGGYTLGIIIYLISSCTPLLSHACVFAYSVEDELAVPG